MLQERSRRRLVLGAKLQTGDPRRVDQDHSLPGEPDGHLGDILRGVRVVGDVGEPARDAPGQRALAGVGNADDGDSPGGRRLLLARGRPLLDGEGRREAGPHLS